MSHCRRHRADANQSLLVGIWCKLGGTDEEFDGVFDRIWGIFGLTCCVEIKNGSKPPSQRKLTKREIEFKERWKGMYAIVENEDDVVTLRNEMKVMSEVLHDYYDQCRQDIIK